MKTLLLWTGVAVLSGMLSIAGPAAAGQSICEDLQHFARSDEMSGVQQWLDEDLFAHGVAPRLRRSTLMAAPTNKAVRREAFKGRLPADYRQVAVLGDWESPEAVFINRGSYLGILIARNNVDALVSKHKTEEHTYRISDRVAVICMPPSYP